MDPSHTSLSHKHTSFMLTRREATQFLLILIFYFSDTLKLKMSSQTQLSTECDPIPRRHSIAVGIRSWSQGQPKDDSLRRSSFTDSLNSLTRSMSAGLSLVQRRTSRSSSFDFGDSQLLVDKNLVQAALCRRYQDQTIKVGCKVYTF